MPGTGPLLERQESFIAARSSTLARRAAGGCVVEAHGDLRPEHVHLAAPLAVIDCLEFDRDLRILDRAEELSFFELECIRMQQADAGRLVRESCLAELGDTVPADVLAFYRSHRAANRARLYAWRSAEPDGDSPEHWLERARSCTSLALQEILAASG
jgi:aminoglycoside phosphotransferase family enzyme